MLVYIKWLFATLKWKSPLVRKTFAAILVLLLLFSVPTLAQQAVSQAAPADLPIHIKARTIWPMKADEKLDCYLYLWTDKGPLRLEDMDTVHTKKMHLFLLTPDFKEFYHAHPIPSGGEGEFRFTVRPERKKPLRLWAEFWIKGKRHVVVTDLDGKTEPMTPLVAPMAVQAETPDIVFTIHFSGELRAGSTTHGTIYAINRNSRMPYTDLEPVLDAFTHVTAFSSDYRTLYHTRPDGPKVTDPNAHGGPGVKFSVTPEKPGMMKIIAQFRTRGQDLLAPFKVRVSPAKTKAPPRHIDEGEETIRPPDAEPPGSF
jgi:hypothetical protein